MPALLIALLFQVQVGVAWIYETLNVTQWEWQSSVVVNDWLYIDGGELYANQDGRDKFFYLGQTISINLSESWTNSTVQKYSIDTQRPVTDGHWSKRPSLFYDSHSNQVVQWGGWPYDNNDLSYVFTFTPNSEGTVAWARNNTPITNFIDSSSPAIFGAAFAASNASFYSLGGEVAEESSSSFTAVQGLVEYEFSNNEWTNSSSVSATSSGFYMGGEAAFTPDFGQAGFLVFIGGGDPGSQSFDIESSPLTDMSIITLYDIAGKAWYHQTATGDIPPPRRFFCAVGGTSAEATFEIFILGGSTNQTFDSKNADDKGYLNVYVLSIPAFRWFQSTDPDQVRRADHSCRVIGQRQMLVIGGTQPSSSLGIAAIDPWQGGLGIFDMSSLTWSDGYDPSAAPYEQSDIVREYYTYSYQVPQWGSPALEPIFAWSPPDQPGPSPTGASGATTGTSSASPTTTPPPNPTSNHTGPIVGGVVGGVCCVVLACLLFWYFSKGKHRDSVKQSSGTEQTAEFLKPELESPDYTKLAFQTDTQELPGDEKKVAQLESPLPELPAEDTTNARYSGRGAAAELP